MQFVIFLRPCFVSETREKRSPKYLVSETWGAPFIIGLLRSLFYSSSIFSVNIIYTLKCKNDPSNIRCQALNSRPLDCKSSPLSLDQGSHPASVLHLGCLCFIAWATGRTFQGRTIIPLWYEQKHSCHSSLHIVLITISIIRYWESDSLH